MVMRVADRQIWFQSGFLGQRQPVVVAVGHTGTSARLVRGPMITQAGIVAGYRRRNFFESGGQPRKKSVSSEANPMVNAARR